MYCLQLKTLITTQAQLRMVNEQTEVRELVSIKQLLAPYTKDVSLGQLSNEESLKFLGPTLVSWSI